MGTVLTFPHLSTCTRTASGVHIFPSGCLISFPNRLDWISLALLLTFETCAHILLYFFPRIATSIRRRILCRVQVYWSSCYCGRYCMVSLCTIFTFDQMSSLAYTDGRYASLCPVRGTRSTLVRVMYQDGKCRRIVCVGLLVVRVQA